MPPVGVKWVTSGSVPYIRIILPVLLLVLTPAQSAASAKRDKDKYEKDEPSSQTELRRAVLERSPPPGSQPGALEVERVERNVYRQDEPVPLQYYKMMTNGVRRIPLRGGEDVRQQPETVRDVRDKKKRSSAESEKARRDIAAGGHIDTTRSLKSAQARAKGSVSFRGAVASRRHTPSSSQVLLRRRRDADDDDDDDDVNDDDDEVDDKTIGNDKIPDDDKTPEALETKDEILSTELDMMMLERKKRRATDQDKFVRIALTGRKLEADDSQAATSPKRRKRQDDVSSIPIIDINRSAQIGGDIDTLQDIQDIAASGGVEDNVDDQDYDDDDDDNSDDVIDMGRRKRGSRRRSGLPGMPRQERDTKSDDTSVNITVKEEPIDSNGSANDSDDLPDEAGDITVIEDDDEDDTEGEEESLRETLTQMLEDMADNDDVLEDNNVVVRRRRSPEDFNPGNTGLSQIQPAGQSSLRSPRDKIGSLGRAEEARVTVETPQDDDKENLALLDDSLFSEENKELSRRARLNVLFSPENEISARGRLSINSSQPRYQSWNAPVQGNVVDKRRRSQYSVGLTELRTTKAPGVFASGDIKTLTEDLKEAFTNWNHPPTTYGGSSNHPQEPDTNLMGLANVNAVNSTADPRRLAISKMPGGALDPQTVNDPIPNSSKTDASTNTLPRGQEALARDLKKVLESLHRRQKPLVMNPYPSLFTQSRTGSVAPGTASGARLGEKGNQTAQPGINIFTAEQGQQNGQQSFVKNDNVGWQILEQVRQNVADGRSNLPRIQTALPGIQDAAPESVIPTFSKSVFPLNETPSASPPKEPTLLDFQKQHSVSGTQLTLTDFVLRRIRPTLPDAVLPITQPQPENDLPGHQSALPQNTLLLELASLLRGNQSSLPVHHVWKNGTNSTVPTPVIPWSGDKPASNETKTDIPGILHNVFPKIEYTSPATAPLLIDTTSNLPETKPALPETELAPSRIYLALSETKPVVPEIILAVPETKTFAETKPTNSETSPAPFATEPASPKIGPVPPALPRTQNPWPEIKPFLPAAHTDAHYLHSSLPEAHERLMHVHINSMLGPGFVSPFVDFPSLLQALLNNQAEKRRHPPPVKAALVAPKLKNSTEPLGAKPAWSLYESIEGANSPVQRSFEHTGYLPRTATRTRTRSKSREATSVIPEFEKDVTSEATLPSMQQFVRDGDMLRLVVDDYIDHRPRRNAGKSSQQQAQDKSTGKTRRMQKKSSELENPQKQADLQEKIRWPRKRKDEPQNTLQTQTEQARDKSRRPRNNKDKAGNSDKSHGEQSQVKTGRPRKDNVETQRLLRSSNNQTPSKSRRPRKDNVETQRPFKTSRGQAQSKPKRSCVVSKETHSSPQTQGDVIVKYADENIRRPRTIETDVMESLFLPKGLRMPETEEDKDTDDADEKDEYDDSDEQFRKKRNMEENVETGVRQKRNSDAVSDDVVSDFPDPDDAREKRSENDFDYLDGRTFLDPPDLRKKRNADDDNIDDDDGSHRRHQNYLRRDLGLRNKRNVEAVEGSIDKSFPYPDDSRKKRSADDDHIDIDDDEDATRRQRSTVDDNDIGDDYFDDIKKRQSAADDDDDVKKRRSATDNDEGDSNDGAVRRELSTDDDDAYYDDVLRRKRSADASEDGKDDIVDDMKRQSTYDTDDMRNSIGDDNIIANKIARIIRRSVNDDGDFRMERGANVGEDNGDNEVDAYLRKTRTANGTNGDVFRRKKSIQTDLNNNDDDGGDVTKDDVTSNESIRRKRSADEYNKNDNNHVDDDFRRKRDEAGDDGDGDDLRRNRRHSDDDDDDNNGGDDDDDVALKTNFTATLESLFADIPDAPQAVRDAAANDDSDASNENDDNGARNRKRRSLDGLGDLKTADRRDGLMKGYNTVKTARAGERVDGYYRRLRQRRTPPAGGANSFK